jgi:hypothetical protein
VVRDVLGVDPGRRGAAVLLRGSRLVVAATWRPSTRGGIGGFRVRLSSGNQTWVESPFEIGRWLALRFRAHALGAWSLAFEESVVVKNPAVSIKVARAAGELSGPLSAYAIGSTSWVRASEWRRHVLGLSPWTGRKRAKAAALDFVPNLVSGFGEIEKILGSSEDLADAAGIAIWQGSRTEEDP